MLKVNIICIGKLKEKYLKQACDEYIKRLSSSCKISIIELNEFKVSEKPTKAQIEMCLHSEGKEIIKNLKDSYVVSLCIEGKSLSSEQLSQKIDKIALSGISEISFVIGSSYGLSDEVKNISSLKLSLSRMTFPHQLVRVLLCEQIYRSFMISSRAKYHK